MKKKRSFITKLNKTKKNKNTVLLVIASIVAAVGTAVFGIFKWKGKKNAHDESKETVKTTAQNDSATADASSTSNGVAAPKPKPPARFAHRKLQPGELDWEQLAKEKETEQIRRGEIPEHMLADVEKPRRGIKRRKWKIALSGVATLLAVAVVSSNIAKYLRPTEAIAKESFSGIGKIVEEHDEGNPYQILNIVPAEAKWSINQLSDDTVSGNDLFSFSMGTMDYLAGGQVLSAELEEALKGNPVFSHYTSREELINKLIPESSVTAFPWIKYEEAYGGIHNVSTSGSWALLFESQEVKVDENYTVTSGITPAEMSDGIFYGDYVQYADGADRAGYDFIQNSGAEGTNIKAGFTGRFVYVLNDPDGDGIGTCFAVSLDDFAKMPDGTVARKAVVYSTFSGVAGSEFYSDDTDIYTYDEDEDRYVYQGTVGEVFKDYRSGGGNSIDDSNSSDDDSSMVSPVTPSDGSWDSEYDADSVQTSTPEPNPTPDFTPDPDSTPDPTPDPEPDPNPTPDPESGPNPAPDPGTTPDPIPDPGTAPDSTPDPAQSVPADTGGVSVMPSDGTVLDISKNAVLAGGWHKLAAEDAESDDINNLPAATWSDENTSSTIAPTEGDVPEIEKPAEGDVPEIEKPAEGGVPETERPVDGGVPETEKPTEDNGESDTLYYILTFEPIEADELLGLGAMDDAILEDEESGGASLLDTSINPDATFTYVGPGLGNYKLTATSNEGGSLIKVYNAPVYFRCQTGNDWLRQYVFNSLAGGDNASSSFQVKVTTVRADRVDTDMVYDADLIYMESGQNMFLSSSLAIDYIQHFEGDSPFSDANDMSASVVSAILNRAAYDLMPIIVDYAIAEEKDLDKYANTNYQLLAKALLKRDLAGYFEAVNMGADLMDNILMNPNADKYPDKIDNNYNYVNQNVYVINDESLVSDDFAVFFDGGKAKAGFNDVLMAIDAENTTLSEKDKISLEVSKARAIQYIINYSVGIIGEFDDLTILELQPTANIVSDLHISQDKTKLYWQTESMKTGKQILYSKNPFSINTDWKSVAEFNGEWEDINGIYDMVFIGLDGQKLNPSDEWPRRAVYNNSELNGKVYHLGDDSGSGTYDSNDITAQKMMDLLEYLRAGYPIVVENDFFTDGTARGASRETINTDYIADGTVMFHFLEAAVTGNAYKNSIFTVSDTVSNTGFMERMKILKPRIELVNEGEGSSSDTSQEVSIVQKLVLDENDEYHGRIAYQIKDNKGEDYSVNTVMHLYADLNYDGIFGEEEELGEEFGAYTNDGSVIDVTISGMGPGVIPWKLEVTDNSEKGNPYRRASVQGYFELTSANEEQIRVLQVTNSKGDPFIDLEAMYKKQDDFVLAKFLKGAETKANLAFEFAALTADELGEILGKNPKYLNQWDIVVLTVDDDITVDSAAFMDYIGEGRSLLVCSQNKGGNLAGLDTKSLGWDPGLNRTYVSLGAANRYHRYAGLEHYMYDPGRAGMRADKINEGSIFYYPYEIEIMNDSFYFAENGTDLRASEYLLDFENNLKSEQEQMETPYVTAWLTFGGNTSTAYGISPKDARNNYYCYSKGNVVYLAQSEYPYQYGEEKTEASAMETAECQFFVNALMAAYSAGIHGSDVSMVSGFAQTSTPVKSISVPFDQEWRETVDEDAETKGILGETVDVYFKFADSNIGANKKVTVSFYYEDPDGTQEFAAGDTTVKASPFSSDIWTVTDNKLVQVTPDDPQNPNQVALVPGKVYQIKAPVRPLQLLTDETVNDAGIYVLVESEFTRSGKIGGKTYKVDGFATVSLNRAKLFLLE